MPIDGSTRTVPLSRAGDTFFDPDLSIEQNAAAYYARARLLRELAGQLWHFADRLKRPVTDPEVSRWISNFFLQTLGIRIAPKQDGSLDLSLSAVYARLELFRQTAERLEQSA